MRNAVARQFLRPYKTPQWAKTLKHQKPSHKLQLAQLPTPIHRWNIPEVPSRFKLSIKRDDVTGCLVTGTKIRKLEFILGRAVMDDCRHVIAAGMVMSNCCRTVAAAARMLDMEPHLIMWDSKMGEGDWSRGNMAMNRLLDASIHHVPFTPDEHTELAPMMTEMQQYIHDKLGEKASVISYGGFDPAGIHGPINAFHEMMTQGVLDDYDDVVLATGSGATATGLAISNYLTGSKLRIHAFISDDSVTYLNDHMTETLREVGLDSINREELLDVVDECCNAGYGISTPDELDLLLTIARSSGVLLDPIYTVKAVQRLLMEMRERPARFRGERVLFLHTGGAFANLDGRLDNLLINTTTTTANHHKHNDTDIHSHSETLLKSES